MNNDITTHELKILRELAGLEPPSPWGAWVGACLEFLQENGYVTKRGEITDKGREALKVAK